MIPIILGYTNKEASSIQYIINLVLDELQSYKKDNGVTSFRLESKSTEKQLALEKFSVKLNLCFQKFLNNNPR